MDRSKLAVLALPLLLALYLAPAFPAEAPVPALPITPILGDPPPAPAQPGVRKQGLGLQAIPAAGLIMDTQDREAVRIFYRGLFFQSEGLPMGWTGNYATGNPGATSQSFQDAVAMRINWHRAMAGVPANISLYGLYNVKDEQAALMMSANNQLSHTPPSTWIYYTADGAEAAGKSNISLGRSGLDAVTYGYIQDSGANNAAGGHRRWLLYPQTQLMGTGDAPGGAFNSTTVPEANAIWVLDGNFGTARPATRDGFVAWPPKGYVPYPVVFGRWSLSYPNADFTHATVTVSKGGTGIPVSIDSASSAGGPNFGENTIVWLLSGFNDVSIPPRPGADESYAVTVSNVLVSGIPQSFSYNVVVFDPDVITPGAAVTTASVPAPATTHAPFGASVAPMSNATGYQLELYGSSALSGALTPANSGSAWTQNVSGYNAIESTEFHLYHAAFATQQITLSKRLYIGQNSSLSFNHRFGFTTETETARVQISLDGGTGWQDVYTRSGVIGNPNPVASAPVTINLSPFTGRMILVRFSFTFSGATYSCGTCGWYFSNVAFINVRELALVSSSTLPPAQPNTSLTAANAGNYLLLARTEYQGTYFGDWGPATLFQVSAAAPDTIAPSIPAAFTATAVSPGIISLAWNASTDNAGGSGVASYKIYRLDLSATTPMGTANASATSASNVGLAASTLYSYTIAACDAAANCSAQSAPALATTLAPPLGNSIFVPILQTGFNLIGNSGNATLNVAAIFGNQDSPVANVTADVVSVWKWNAASGRWAFHSPQLTVAGNLAYASSHNYEVLSTLVAGEGYWVNAINPLTLPQQSAPGFSWNALNFANLVSGFNLIATGDHLTPSQFNAYVSAAPPAPGSIPTANFVSLWAWDAAAGKWYFYSPLLESSGGLPAVKSYADGHNYLHFQDAGKTLGIGSGFWVNRP